MSLILPSYQSGFAPRDYEPAYPSLWQGCVAAYAPLLGPTGLVLRDVTAAENHGVLTSGPTWDISGGRYALGFDGVNDYVETNLIQPSSVFTVTGFASIDSFANSPLIYTWIGPGNSDRGFLETNSTGTQLYFGVRNTSVGQTSARFYTLSEALEVGKFFHFATVKTPGIDTGELYVNGVRQTSYTGQLYATPGAGNLRLAAYHTANALFMDGRLDDIRVYDRVLSDNEIRLLATRRGIGYDLRTHRSYSKTQSSGLRKRILTGLP